MSDKLYRVGELTPEKCGNFWERIQYSKGEYAVVDGRPARPIIRAEDAERKVRLAEAALAVFRDCWDKPTIYWEVEDAQRAEDVGEHEEAELYRDLYIAIRAIEEAKSE